MVKIDQQNYNKIFQHDMIDNSRNFMCIIRIPQKTEMYIAITNCMEHNPSLEVKSTSHRQEIPES
jgi:hypothetical protein